MKNIFQKIIPFEGLCVLLIACIVPLFLVSAPISSFMGFFPTLFVRFLAMVFGGISAASILYLLTSLPEDSHFFSISSKYLGFWGTLIITSLFVFLTYSLLISFLSQFYLLISSRLIVVPFLNSFGIISFLVCLWIWICSLFGKRIFAWIAAFILFLTISRFWQLTPLDNTEKVSFPIGLFKVENLGLWGIIFPLLFLEFRLHFLIPRIASVKTQEKTTLYLLCTALVISFIGYSFLDYFLLTIFPSHDLSAHWLSSYPILIQLLPLGLGSTAKSVFLFALIAAVFAIGTAVIDFWSDVIKSKHFYVKPLVGALLCLPTFLCATLFPKVCIDFLTYFGFASQLILCGIFPISAVLLSQDLNPDSPFGTILKRPILVASLFFFVALLTMNVLNLLWVLL